MILYFVWVGVGIVAAFLARRLIGSATRLSERERMGVLYLAIGGAIFGAYGLQLPADLFGWNAPVDPAFAGPDGLPLGGRTVLGGLIGGWLAVELGKRAFGIRTATGDDFALPLAIALGFGRFGCMAAGCCAGRPCEPSPFAHMDVHGVSHIPVQLIEAGFHFASAFAIYYAIQRCVLVGRRLALYLTIYAAVRFALEFERVNPVVALGLTYHQFLAVGLCALAGITFIRRTRRAQRVG